MLAIQNIRQKMETSTCTQCIKNECVSAVGFCADLCSYLQYQGSALGCLPQVVVVQDDAHGLSKDTEGAPEDRVADEGVVEAPVHVLGHHNQRGLGQHADEGVAGDVAEGQ